MIQLIPKLLTVDNFITQYGDNERYELIDGELIEMEPTGLHEQVAALIGRKLNVEIDEVIVPPPWHGGRTMTVRTRLTLSHIDVSSNF